MRSARLTWSKGKPDGPYRNPDECKGFSPYRPRPVTVVVMPTVSSIDGRPCIDQQSEAALSPPLTSWKEIAAYLGKSVRTAQRWDRHLNLPIRRPGPQRRIVVAVREELDAWVRLWRLSAAPVNEGRPQAQAPLAPEVVRQMCRQIGVSRQECERHWQVFLSNLDEASTTKEPRSPKILRMPERTPGRADGAANSETTLSCVATSD